MRHLFVIASAIAFSSSAEAVRPGDRAPEFRLKNLAGETVALSSFRGAKVVLLDFWASWCKGCKKELPALHALARARQKDVVLLAVSLDRDVADARKFQGATELPTRSVLVDPDATVFDAYEMVKLPSLIVIDRRGIVRFVHGGAERNLVKTLTAEIDALGRGK
ncbi:MAG: TlpA family protein disulfide reductase [Deltaproteobacteria bacterium]|nr:TlpA family protein disulfide reductase [Deltaproteobacteria bacterium]